MVKRGLVSDSTSALVPGRAGAEMSPLSTFGVILLMPKVPIQLPALCAEAPEATVIAAARASSFTVVLNFIWSPNSYWMCLQPALDHHLLGHIARQQQVAERRRMDVVG